MDRVEAREQLRALEEQVRIYDASHRFTATDVRRIHKVWLGPVYPWAGNYRQVNISKDDFPFAAAREIPRLMSELERDHLRKFTPCRFASPDEVARALAVVHVELMLIHPFREGNGRVGRLLSILMALQAGLPPLDFRGIKGRRRQEYFVAVRAGLERSYEPMERIFGGVIRRTFRARGRQFPWV